MEPETLNRLALSATGLAGVSWLASAHFDSLLALVLGFACWLVGVTFLAAYASVVITESLRDLPWSIALEEPSAESA